MKILEIIKSSTNHHSKTNDIDIALYSKLNHGILLDFTLEDKDSLNLKLKRLIIRCDEQDSNSKLMKLFNSNQIL